MNQRLSLVTLGVRDLPKARAFYESLGWQPSSASCAQVCFFQTGSMGIALYPVKALLADAGLTNANPIPGGITLGINVSLREEVDRELAAVLACGATLLQSAVDTPWGGRTAYFADPDGHPWEITWAPMFPLGPEGELRLP
ncbi:MAG: VOC family protein [Magnetococcales bacterium]|nr:VOC family protein [Magnetococcales bacterium]